MSQRPALDETHLPIIRRLGRRVKNGQPWGITAPDVAELFDLDPKTAWRNLERFCKQGWMCKTELRRHRLDMVDRTGKPAIIYVTTRKHMEEPRWRQLFRTRQSAPQQTV